MKHKNNVDNITVNSAVLPRFAPTHRNPIRFAAKKKKKKKKNKKKKNKGKEECKKMINKRIRKSKR